MIHLPYNFKVEDLIEEGRTSREAVDSIKQWLVTANLPVFQDELIVLFLLSCNHQLEATKTTIKAYFDHKNKAPEMFNDRDVDGEELQKITDVVTAVSIPTRTDANEVVHFFKLNDTRYSRFHLIPAMKLAYMLVDISTNRHPPDGLIVVMDMQGIGLMHLTKFRVDPLRKFMGFLQEAMPLQIKAIHILNATYIFDKIMDLIKMFMKSDLINMIHTHSSRIDMNEFHEKHVPAKCLPQEYGGELPSSEELNQRTVEQFRDLKEFFEAEEGLRSSK